MEIKSIGIRREGDYDHPNTKVVVEIQLPDGRYITVGRVRLFDNFSEYWNLDLLKTGPDNE